MGACVVVVSYALIFGRTQNGRHKAPSQSTNGEGSLPYLENSFNGCNTAVTSHPHVCQYSRASSRSMRVRTQHANDARRLSQLALVSPERYTM